ncbi:Lactonase, 7-bladed beta-propeller-domain-containing protein [Hypoxylon sp. FL1150]|nr:Lactonase, 7-bladed beta-propeller-domain-containing protein [Hypoxylon sp. FL1150]
MRCLQVLSTVASFMALAEAAKHQLIIGTFSTNFLYSAEYDDKAQTLELIKTTPAQGASSWISLSHDKKNLYGTDWNAETPSFVSYSVKDASTIDFEVRLDGSSECTGMKSIYIEGSPEPPYAVYGNYFYGDAKCGTVMSVHDNGTLRSVIQNYQYANGSAIHGLSFSADHKYLYSADDGGNSLWVHAIGDDGTLELHDQMTWPDDGADPRHVVTHPAGGYVYTVLEASSLVGQCITNELGNLYTLNQSFSLVKDGDDPKDFWADEVALSANNQYLWASNRAKNAIRKGYISAFEVNEHGALMQQYFLTETTNSGGFANAVSPSPFDDGLVAITDNSTGFVEMWKMNDDKTGASVVAHLDIDDGHGCCANAVWYS